MELAKNRNIEYKIAKTYFVLDHHLYEGHFHIFIQFMQYFTREGAMSSLLQIHAEDKHSEAYQSQAQ